MRGDSDIRRTVKSVSARVNGQDCYVPVTPAGSGNWLAPGPAGTDDRRVNETWMLDELAHAGPEHLDAGFIAGFDRKQGYPDAEADIAAFEAHGLGSVGGHRLRRGDRAVRHSGRTALRPGDRRGRVARHAQAIAAKAGAARPGGPVRSALSASAAGSSATSPQRPSTASTPATRCTSSPTSGRRSRCAASRTCCGPAGYCGCATCLRLRARRGGGGLRRLARRRGGRPGRGVHRGRLRRAHPHRAQHVPLAARADARRGRARDRRGQLRAPPLRRLHLRKAGDVCRNRR